jgi:hypothetical protein
MFNLMPIPPVIQGRSTWYGPEMAASREWVEHLSPMEIAEIDAAARRFVSVCPIRGLFRKSMG